MLAVSENHPARSTLLLDARRGRQRADPDRSDAGVPAAVQGHRAAARKASASIAAGFPIAAGAPKRSAA